MDAQVLRKQTGILEQIDLVVLVTSEDFQPHRGGGIRNLRSVVNLVVVVDSALDISPLEFSQEVLVMLNLFESIERRSSEFNEVLYIVKQS